MTIYQHFRTEERPFVDQVLEWQEDVKHRYKERLSDFLDPRQQEIVRMVIGNDDEISLSFLGGLEHAERKRALLTPPYLETSEEDFQLALFSIDYPEKFVTLKHRDILGAMLNLGLKREKFGDIILADGMVQVMTTSDVAEYVELNVQKIGKATVKLNRIPLTEHIKPEEDWEEGSATVSSMRLDVVLSQIYRLSRTKVSPYIDKGLVKVNWKVIDQPAFVVATGDYLSVRGYGRAYIIDTLGITKKDKIRLHYKKVRT
ncbi:RNA-binding protein [bacterium LRH843]|nr:RNA-binding protein [bacterium LRH843]